MIFAKEFADATSVNISTQVCDTKMIVFGQLDALLDEPIALIFMALFQALQVS